MHLLLLCFSSDSDFGFLFCAFDLNSNVHYSSLKTAENDDIVFIYSMLKREREKFNIVDCLKLFSVKLIE